MPELKKEWGEAPANLNDRDLILAQRKMGFQYGLKPYDKYECVGDLRSFLRSTPKMYVCRTVDPAAKTDVSDGADWARNQLGNSKVVRLQRAYEFLQRQ